MKTKTTFNVGDQVTTPTSTGKIIAFAPFADHLEFLVEFLDATATWYHEDALKPATTPKSPLSTR